MGAGRKHGEVEKGQAKAKKKKRKKIPPSSGGKKKKRLLVWVRGTASLKETEQISQAKLFQTIKGKIYWERRSTQLGSAPALSTACSHTRTFPAFPREASQTGTLLPLDGHVKTQQH